MQKPQLQHLTPQMKSRPSINFKFVGSNIPKHLLGVFAGLVPVGEHVSCLCVLNVVAGLNPVGVLKHIFVCFNIRIMLVVCLLVLIFLSLYWSVDTGSNHVGGLFVGSNIPKSLLEC